MRRFIQQTNLILTLLVFSAAIAHAQLTVQSGVTLSTSGNVVITLQDIDLILDGAISQHPGDGSWSFTGSGNNTISGSSSPIFDKLQIAKTGSAKIILSQNINIAGSIDFQSGLVDLNNNNILLQNGAMLNGENELSRIIGTGGGYVEANSNLNAPVTANPGNLGALISSAQNLGNTVVRRGHGSQTNSGGSGSSILRYYDILPAINTALNATLRIGYLDAELNGLNKSTLVLYKSIDTLHWTNMGYTARDASANYVEDSGIADFSRWTLSSANNPLPVKFTSFAVECLNGSAYISWQTAQEQHSSRFDVERSVDGIQWTTIGSLAAAGNSNLPKNYSYMDGAAVSGTAVFRVVEFDLDGAATYSTTASTNCGIADNDARVYPNPVKDILYVSLNTPIASIMKIEIYDGAGAKTYTQIAHLTEGNNKLGIDTKALPPGLYFLDLQWDNGHRTKTVKIEKD